MSINSRLLKLPPKVLPKQEQAIESTKENDDIKHSLRHLTECMISMTREIKEMKENQKSQRLDGLKVEQTHNGLKHLTQCVIETTKRMKEMKKDNQKLAEKLNDLRLNQQEVKKSQILEGTPLDSRMEKRFQDIDLPIPELPQMQDLSQSEIPGQELLQQEEQIQSPTNCIQQEREKLILEWITKLCKTVFSIGFNLYESGVLDINKVKAYCSENLIRNFIKFFNKNQLALKEIDQISDFLVEDLLPYFCLKYPQSEEAETSTKFSSGLIQRDDMDNNDYDLIYKSGVDFSYQQSGNYNSQIMKFLNYIISLPQKKIPLKSNSKTEGKAQKALNDLFIEDMRNIFMMVEVEENVINMQQYDPKNPDKMKKQVPKTEIKQAEKEKENMKDLQDEEKQKRKKQIDYREKVKTYTSFQIGQKLSKNLKLFSNSDMKSGNLALKSSDIIRVLTKWAEELEKCFKREYFQERDAPFRMKDGSQGYLDSSYTLRLISCFEAGSNAIEATKKEIRQNNNKNQQLLMRQPIFERLLHLSESEASVGQFSSSIFKNNITYLISYLNVLIQYMRLTKS